MFRSLIKFSLFFFILGLSSSSWACKIDVGWTDTPPFQYIEDGTLTGLDIDIMNAMAKEMGCRVRYIKMPRKRQFRSVQEGKLDVVLGTLKTDHRGVFSHFSVPIRSKDYGLFYLKDNTPKRLEKVIIDNGIIGLVSSTEYGPKVKEAVEKYPSNFAFAYSNESNFRKLKRNRIDALISERFTGFADAQSLKVPVHIYPKKVYKAPVFFMLTRKRDNAERFMRQLNMGFYAILASKAYYKILFQYEQFY